MGWFDALRRMNEKISNTTIPDTVNNYAEWIESEAEKKKNEIKDTVTDKVGGYVDYVENNVVPVVNDTVDTVKDTVSGAVNTGKEIAGKVGDAIETGKELVSDVKTVASGGLDGLSGYADYIENGAPGKTDHSTPPEPTAPAPKAPSAPEAPSAPTPETPSVPAPETPSAPAPEAPSAPAPDLTAGAMSYADYVTKTGGDPAADAEAAKKRAQENYNKTVLDASREYDRARAAYGAEGEAMARAGLGGSGYADYLDAQAYAARQGSVDSARDTRQNALDLADANQKNAERELQRGYLDYIENYKSGQKADFNSAMNYLINGNLSGDQARSYLEMMGLGSQADSILAITDPIVQKNLSGESHTQASKWLDDTLSKGYTGKDAYDYAKFLGASDEEAAYIQRMADAQANNANAGADDANRSSAYNAVVSAGATTEEEAYNIVKQYIKDDDLAKEIAAAAVQTSSRLKSELSSEDAETRRQSAAQALISTGLTDLEELKEFAKNWGLTDGADIDAAAAMAFAVNGKLAADKADAEGKSEAEKKRENELTALDYLINNGLTGDAAASALSVFGISGDDATRIASSAKAVIDANNAAEDEESADRLRANIGSTLSQIISLGYTGEDAKKYAKSLGYSDEDALALSQLADSYAANIGEEEGEALKSNVMGQILSMGLRGEGARALAKAMGLDDEAAAAIVAETDKVIGAQSTEELRANLPSFMATVISNGWDEDTARDIARAAGYDEDAVTEIIGIAQKNASMSEDMASAFSGILSYRMTGNDAIGFAMDMFNLSKSDAEKVVKYTDGILSRAEETADDTDTTIDFTATGMEMSDYADMYKIASAFTPEEREALVNETMTGSEYSEEEVAAIAGGADKLDDYLRRIWKSKGYSDDEIISMLALVKEHANA